MSTALQSIENDLIPPKSNANAGVDLRIGDTVRVHVRIKEGEKSRIQVFEGIVIGCHNSGIRSTFTVRKVSYNVGVERIFPVYSPTVDKIEVKVHHKVRRGKLYFLRGRSGKSARLKEIGF